VNKTVVITGIGLVVPNGTGKAEVWDRTLTGTSVTRHLDRFDSTDFSCGFAGQIEGFDAVRYMPARLARKLDPYTQYAVAAAQLAVEDGGLALEQIDRLRAGVYVGNCFGGWVYTDTELRKLHSRGVHAVSPFQATAWFPAAPQGQISILMGLRGHSKTVVCDRASGLVSVGLAARVIASGTCDLMLAGGTEAPLTPFAYLACTQDRILVSDRTLDPNCAYRPFDTRHAGIVPAEGAAFLILEELEHAQRRGAHIYAQLNGFAQTNDATQPEPLPRADRYFSAAIAGALDDAAIEPDQVSLVFADAMGTEAGDQLEVEALMKVFGSRSREVAVTAPKSMIGHTYGAAGALDLALAALAVDEQVSPPTANFEHAAASCELSIVASARRMPIEHVLVNSRGSGGINASVVLSAHAQSTH
jgi:3-oxoacyl-[acyl-carrier-protein] synthase II